MYTQLTCEHTQRKENSERVFKEKVQVRGTFLPHSDHPPTGRSFQGPTNCWCTMHLTMGSKSGFQTFTDQPTNAGHANTLSLSLMNPFCSYTDCLTPALWYCWPICVLIYHESFLPPQFSIFFESDQVLSASQCVFISLTHTTTHTNTIS